MQILSFRVPDEIAEEIDNRAKRAGLSRNEYLFRIVNSAMLEDPDKARNVRLITASLIEKGLQKNEERASRLLERSPFIKSFMKVAPSLLSKLTRPPSRALREWEVRVLRDLRDVAKKMELSSSESLDVAVEVMAEMIKSLTFQMEEKNLKYLSSLKDALFRLLSTLLYPNRELAAEVFLHVCKSLNLNKEVKDYRT